MPTNTTNFNLIKPIQGEFYNVDVSNSNMDTIDGVLKALQDAISSGASEQDLITLRNALTTHLADNTGHVYYADDTGTANAKVVVLNPIPIDYKKGMGISFTNQVQNTGAVTINVNGLGAKPILKSNGNAIVSGNLKANSIYTVRYNGTSFILQGEGGGGNAIASDLLSGKTASTDAGDVVGTMPNYAGAGFETTNIKFPPGYSDSILDIYQPNSGYVTPGSFLEIADSDFKAHNIRAGINIFGLPGTLTPNSMGGAQRYASGTVATTPTNAYFVPIGETMTVQRYSVSVSLDFEPDLVYLRCWFPGSVTYVTVYSNMGEGYPKVVHMGGSAITNGNSQAMMAYKADMHSAYINSTGFRFPALSHPTAVYRWDAIKY